MRLTDLELLRWKLFHDEYVKQAEIIKEKADPYNGLKNYWKQLGAYVSTLPRQTGKTTMLSKLISEFEKAKEDYLLIFPSITMSQRAIKFRGFDKNKTIGSTQFSDNRISAPECNLLIDEYQIFDNEALDKILNMPWKTVTMVGTLR